MVSRSPSSSKKVKPAAAAASASKKPAATKLKPSLVKKSSKVTTPLRKKKKKDEEEESEEEEASDEEEEEEEEEADASSSEDDASDSSSEEDEDDPMNLYDISEGDEPRQSVADALKLKKAPKKAKPAKSEAQEKAAQTAKARRRKRDALERRLQREKFVEGKEASMPIKDAACVTAVRRIGFQMDGHHVRFSVKAARLLMDHAFKSLVCTVLPEVREIQMPASKWTDAYQAQKQVRRIKSRASLVEQAYKRHLRATDVLGVDSVETMNLILERFTTNPQTLARQKIKAEKKQKADAHAANVARSVVLTAKESEETITELERAELLQVTLAIEEVETARAKKKRDEIKANIKMQEEAADHIEKVSLPARMAFLAQLNGDGDKSMSHLSRVLSDATHAFEALKPGIDAKTAEIKALLGDKAKLGKELHTEETLEEIADTKAKLKEVRKRFKAEGTLSIGREAEALEAALEVLQATLSPDAAALNDQIKIEKERLAVLRKARSEAEKAVKEAQARRDMGAKHQTKWVEDAASKKARMELHRKTAAAKRVELKEFEKQLREHKQSIKLGNSMLAASSSSPMEE